MSQLLFIGGVIAGGFDQAGKYLLVVSHSGRGVYEVDTWKRVARDKARAYPEQGIVGGIGPIAGQAIKVTEMDYDTEMLEFASPDGEFTVRYSEGTLTITRAEEGGPEKTPNKAPEPTPTSVTPPANERKTG